MKWKIILFIIMGVTMTGIVNAAIYNYSSGNLKAYQMNGTPSSPFDNSLVEAGTANYTLINDSDNTRWNTTYAQNDGELDSQVYIFNMSDYVDDIDNVDYMNITWEGYGENKSDYYTNFSFWNWTSSSWLELETKDFTSQADVSIPIAVSGGFSDHINSTSKEVAVWVSTRKYVAPSCSGWEDGGYCWYFGGAGQSCDTVCTTHGGCVAEHWNDDGSCTRLDHFTSCNRCDWDASAYAPFASGRSYELCKYRVLFGQSCSASTPGAKRLCACTNSPFIYYYANYQYIYLSDFIPGATSKEKEYTSFIDLTGRAEVVNGKVKIKITEELDETTYLDRVYLRVMTYDYTSVNVEAATISDANMSLITHSDNKYLVMEQGDEHYLEFNVPLDYKRIEFISEGYYIEHYKQADNRGSLHTDYIEMDFDVIHPFPLVDFASPTPDNGSTEESNSIYVNVTSSDADTTHYTFLDFDHDLLVWMRMDDVNQTGEDAIVYDNSSYKHHGEATGTAKQIDDGFYGKAFYFNVSDGNGDSIGVTDANTLDVGELTIALWIKPEVSAKNTLIACRTSGFNFRPHYSNNILQFNDGTGGFVNSSNNAFIPNVWTHAAVTVNSTTVIFYVNGTAFGSDTGTHDISNNNNALSIGGQCGIGSSADGYNGTMDELLIFNRSLDATEIDAIYNATATQYQHNFTSLSDKTYNFTGFAVDTDGNWNMTSYRYVTVSTTDCSCSSASCSVDCADNCTFSANIDLSDTSITVTGSGGNVTFKGNVTNIGNISFKPTGSCILAAFAKFGDYTSGK